MTFLIAAPLAVVISLMWYLPGVRAQGENRTLQRKDYIRIALVYGLAFTCALIILTEILWDTLADLTPLSDLAKELVSDFFRAALLEELFKLLGFRMARERYALSRKTDYMLAAGLICWATARSHPPHPLWNRRQPPQRSRRLHPPLSRAISSGRSAATK